MREPVSIQRLLVWITILGILGLVIYFGALRVALEKLGISPLLAWLFIICSVIGSSINLPLLRLSARGSESGSRRQYFILNRAGQLRHSLIIAINLGGGLLPMLFSTYLVIQQPLPILQSLLAISLVAGISYLFSFTIPGIGIGMPIFVAPISAAVIALTLNPAHAPALSYVAGTLGVLVGADLLRLNEIRRMPTNFASIGGAGTFDGVFLSGVIAVLLT